MKISSLAPTLIKISVIGFMVLQFSAVQADSRGKMVGVVQLLGYGGAIHNFKNYVLRGEHRESYGAIASDQFQQVKGLLKEIKSDQTLTGREREAVGKIEMTVQSYLDGLKKIQGLFEKKWRLEDVDRVVIVDDTPALQGLAVLRKKWQWTAMEQVVFDLGYGGAIHHFKNYVLRANDAYYTNALEKFLAVESLLGDQLSRTDVDDQFMADISAIERVSHAYMEYLALIERLIRMQRPIRQIDLAVKINDAPAIAALSRIHQVTGR